MKKILLIFFLIILMPMTIKAQTNDSRLQQQYIGNIYSVFKMSNGEYYLYLQDLFIMNGKTAYCIEPNVHITTSIYTSTSNFDELNLPGEIKDKIKLIAYYGYDYFNKSDIKYFLAAQELIWETVLNGKGEVYWTSIDQVHGPQIDIEKEKTIILDKVSKNDVYPSFNNASYDFKKGDKIIIEDNNLVLDNFIIDNNNDAYIKDNKLYIEESKEINLIRKSYTDEVFMFYYAGSSQKFLTSGYLDEMKANVKINIHSGKINISKIGENMYINNGFNYEKISLEGVKFHLIAATPIIINNETIYEKGDVIGVYQTDKNGHLTIDNLYFGEYILKEVASSMGNIVEDNNYTISLIYNINNLSSSEQSVKVVNRLPKATLELLKVDSQNNSPIADVKFGLFTNDNDFIMELITDKEGKINLENIPLGKYYIVETETIEGYELNSERIYFEIKEDKETIYLNIKNEPVIEVPNTSLNKNYSYVIILITSLLMGIILVIYDKKNRNNTNFIK